MGQVPFWIASFGLLLIAGKIRAGMQYIHSIHMLQSSINTFSFQLLYYNNNLSCVSLVPEYNLLSTDELCSDQGMLILADRRECRKAARTLNLKLPLRNTITKNWPKACYYDTRLTGEVVFNTHSTGSRIHLAKPICRTGKYSNMCWELDNLQ